MSLKLDFIIVFLISGLVALVDVHRERVALAMTLQDPSLLVCQPQERQYLEAMSRLIPSLAENSLRGFGVRFLLSRPSPIGKGSLVSTTTWIDWCRTHVHHAAVCKWVLICQFYLACVLLIFSCLATVKGEKNLVLESNEYDFVIYQLFAILFVFDVVVASALGSFYSYVHAGYNPEHAPGVATVFWAAMEIVSYLLAVAFGLIKLASWWFLLLAVLPMLPLLLLHGWICSLL